MAKKGNAPVEAATSGKGAGAMEMSRFDSTLAELFGQACVMVLHLNEKKDADGYGLYSLSFTDACLSVYKCRAGDEAASYIFSIYACEINDIGLDTALRSLIEVLGGEAE